MLFLVIALIRFMHQKFQLAIKSLGILRAWAASWKSCNVEALEILGFHVVKLEVKFRANGCRGMAGKQNSLVRHGKLGRILRPESTESTRLIPSTYDTGQSLMSSPNKARPGGHRERRDVKHCACPPI